MDDCGPTKLYRQPTDNQAGGTESTSINSHTRQMLSLQQEIRCSGVAWGFLCAPEINVKMG